MFAAHCSGHGRTVLVFPSSISALEHRPDGVEVRWRCVCGETGTTLIPRRSRRGGPPSRLA